MYDANYPAHDGLRETILEGRYRLMESIGDGGMGRVYAAEHITLRKRVAIKVLREELSRVDANVERFFQEAQAASMTNHPNVVDITDVGRTSAGTVFFVMEFLEGEELAVLMHRESRIDWPRVQKIAIQVARGLHAAHQAGVIHRDMKPANIFLSRTAGGEEQVKLLDFGIAKLQREGRRPLTSNGSVFGTARYMSPEQAGGKEVDARTDIYSVGVILYEMLTGQAPFEGDNFIQVANRHINDPVTPLRTAAPRAGIPDVVCDLVMRALEKDPERRFQNMAEFEAAILGASFESTVATANPLLMDGVDRTIVYHAELGRLAREAAMGGGAPEQVPEDRTVMRPRPVLARKAQPVFARAQTPAPSRPVFAEPVVPQPPMMEDMRGNGATYPPPPSRFGAPEVRAGEGAFFAASAASDAYGEGASPVLPAGASMPSDGPAHHHTLPPAYSLAAANPSTYEHARGHDEGRDTVEFSLKVPRTEVSRNVLVIVVAAIAVLMIAGGAAVGALFFDDGPAVVEDVHPAVVLDQPRPTALPPPIAPRVVTPATPPDPGPVAAPPTRRPAAPEVDDVEAQDEPRRPTSDRPKSRGTESDARGFAKAKGAIQNCGNQHGAFEGTKIDVSYEVRDGRAQDVTVGRPYGATPLGRCIATAVESKARFGASVKAERYTRKVSF